jgi:hypothetical protein
MFCKERGSSNSAFHCKNYRQLAAFSQVKIMKKQKNIYLIYAQTA